MGNQVFSTEKDLRSPEGVVEDEPGQSSSTSQKLSGTAISHPEILTPLLENQSGGDVIIDARTCGSNEVVSQPVGKGQFSLFGQNVSSSDSGLRIESSAGSSHSKYDRQSRQEEAGRSETSVKRRLVDEDSLCEIRGESVLYRTAPCSPCSPYWSPIDSDQTTEEFIETMKKRIQVRTPLSERLEFADSSDIEYSGLKPRISNEERR
jgi:hypothetical protein